MENNKSYIYSIGYGNRSITIFFDLLKKYNIEYLIDVRSIPYSKYNPDFQKIQLETHSKINLIKYVFMGDLLGGRPEDETDYTSGKVDYNYLSQELNFQKGIARLVESNSKKIVICLMCSEIKPENCHRSKLIGRALKKNGVEIFHIDEADQLKCQDDVMHIVTKGLGEIDLFGEKPLSSRKKYNK